MDLTKKKRRLKEHHCSECGQEILVINRTTTVKCADCFNRNMNIYRRGFREDVIVDIGARTQAN